MRRDWLSKQGKFCKRPLIMNLLFTLEVEPLFTLFYKRD